VDKVWLVVGEKGEYSDFSTWDVAAYPEKDVAEIHARKANEEVERILALRESLDDDYEKEREAEKAGLMRNSFDPLYDSDVRWSQKPVYSAEEVLLCAHPDQFLDVVDDLVQEKNRLEEARLAEIRAREDARIRKMWGRGHH
jgi:hypothetical protein